MIAITRYHARYRRLPRLTALLLSHYGHSGLRILYRHLTAPSELSARAIGEAFTWRRI